LGVIFAKPVPQVLHRNNVHALYLRLDIIFYLVVTLLLHDVLQDLEVLVVVGVVAGFEFLARTL
jgi:hypothetical protein